MRFRTLLVLLFSLLLVGSAFAQETDTFVTAGGMSITYPASYTATLNDSMETSLDLTRLDTSGFSTLRIIGGEDLLSALSLSEMPADAEGLLDTYRNSMFGTFDSADVQEVTLANGRALVQPYRSMLGYALAIMVQLNSGELVFIEVVSFVEGDENPLLAEQDLYLAVAESIAFDAEPTITVEEDDSASLQTLALPARALAPDEMPEGLIILSNDVLIMVPEDWSLADTSEVYEGAGLNYRGFAATAAVTASSTEGFISFEDWRDSMSMFMSAMFSEAGELPEPTLLERADGRIAERYASLDGRILYYTIELGGGLGATITIFAIMLDDADLPDLMESADQLAIGMTRFNRDSSAEVLELDCNAQLPLQEGDEQQVLCPAGCNSGSLWGTDVYTSDSAVCTAAVHAGVISLAEGGTVLVSYAPGQESYEGTTQNDITSSSWGSYGGSFSVAPGG
jgi:hypothetical protein